MFLLLILLCCSAALEAAQVNQAQYTLTRKREISSKLLCLKTALIHHKTKSNAYFTEDFLVEEVNDNKITLGHWCGQGSGTCTHSLDNEMFRRVFKKAREKYLNETDEYSHDALMQAVKGPEQEFHFNRTDLPDEPASPVCTLPAERKKSSWWCTIL